MKRILSMLFVVMLIFTSILFAGCDERIIIDSTVKDVNIVSLPNSNYKLQTITFDSNAVIFITRFSTDLEPVGNGIHVIVIEDHWGDRIFQYPDYNKKK